jgi:hypothetical protein
VGDGIGIGVTGQAAGVRYGDPAKNQRAALHEPMRVVADADSSHAATVAGCSMIE